MFSAPWFLYVCFVHCCFVCFYTVPCFGAIETLPDLDTADANWQDIDVQSLSETMRYMYSHLSDQRNKDKYKKTCIEKSLEYSHESVGKIIKEILK